MRKSENVRSKLCTLLGLQLNCNETVVLGLAKDTTQPISDVAPMNETQINETQFNEVEPDQIQSETEPQPITEEEKKDQ